MFVGLLLTIFSLSLTKRDNLVAYIYKENDLVLTIDLSKEDKERTFEIDTYVNKMEIAVKKNAIKVSHSSCPHQDCVKMGYVSNTNRPIICLYHKILIEIKNKDQNLSIEV